MVGHTLPQVNYSRPSIDVFFESAALAWSEELIGILLTGANMDGAAGIQAIKKHGGLPLAQDPAEAKHPVMPQVAINKISKFLQSIPGSNSKCAEKM